MTISEAPETMSLDAVIQSAIRTSLQSEQLAAKVSAAADKAVESAISDAFCYGSAFRKNVETAVREVLPQVDVDRLANFANAVRCVIQRRLANLANEVFENEKTK